MGCGSDADPDRRGIEFNQKGVAGVIVLALIEGSQQTYARLNREDSP